MRHPSTSRTGAGMTEYVIVVVLTAIAVLVGVLRFGWTIEEKTVGAETTVAIEVDTDAR